MRSGYESDLKEEVLLTSQRLASGQPPPSRYAKSTESNELDDLRSDNSRLRSQLESLKDMCKLYQEDSEKATRQLKDLKEELYKQRLEYEKVIRAIETKSATREIELQGDREQVNKDFEEYKREVEKELQLRELVAERQNKYIQALQEELKSAKIVIKSPRLKAKMLAKLKEFNVTVEDSEEFSSQYSKGSSTPRASKTPVRRQKYRFKGSISKEFNPIDHMNYMKTVSMDASIPPVDPPRSSKPLFPYLNSSFQDPLQRTSNLE